MRRRRHTWLWRCELCGHRQYDNDGLDALESFERHYMQEHMTKENR